MTARCRRSLAGIRHLIDCLAVVVDAENNRTYRSARIVVHRRRWLINRTNSHYSRAVDSPSSRTLVASASFHFVMMVACNVAWGDDVSDSAASAGVICTCQILMCRLLRCMGGFRGRIWRLKPPSPLELMRSIDHCGSAGVVGHFIQLHTRPVASLRLVSPGAVTNGVTLIFCLKKAWLFSHRPQKWWFSSYHRSSSSLPHSPPSSWSFIQCSL